VRGAGAGAEAVDADAASAACDTPIADISMDPPMMQLTQAKRTGFMVLFLPSCTEIEG